MNGNCSCQRQQRNAPGSSLNVSGQESLTGRLLSRLKLCSRGSHPPNPVRVKGQHLMQHIHYCRCRSVPHRSCSNTPRLCFLVTQLCCRVPAQQRRQPSEEGGGAADVKSGQLFWRMKQLQPRLRSRLLSVTGSVGFWTRAQTPCRISPLKDELVLVGPGGRQQRAPNFLH